MTNQRIDLFAGQRKLVLIWLIGSCPSIILLLIRSFGPNAEDIDKVWSWLLPSIMPTLSLVVGTYAATAVTQLREDRTVDLLFFRVAAALSLVYLLIVTLTVCIYPLSSSPATTVLARIGLILGPVQGLVSACLGVFFISNRQAA
jgi:hypothetical protein